MTNPNHLYWHNQVAQPATHYTWSNLRFRSESEVRVAQALDRSGVLFFPNCMARLGTPDSRQNREPDFLICVSGRWGILECDGEPFHPASRAAHDHKRDRLFKLHGIPIIERFDARDCWHYPDKVVEEFLKILAG